MTKITPAQAYTPALTEKKINQSIRLLKAYDRFCNLTLAYSGGKDSEIVRHLCQLAHVKVDLVYNSTTIDPPGTISYCQKRHVTINRPKITFFQLIAKKGLPSMFRRFCCRELKEKYIAPHLVLGIRQDESIKRSKRYVEPSACRIYSASSRAEQVLPIVHWNISDEIYFAQQEPIEFHPVYYKDGVLDLNNRVGCLGCPLQGDRGVGDFLRYPKFLKKWCQNYQIYVDSHKAIEGVYEDIVWHLFYSNHGDHRYQQTYHGLFDAPNARDFLSDYFKINL